MDTSVKIGFLEMSRGLLLLVTALGLMAIFPLWYIYHHLSRKSN